MTLYKYKFFLVSLAVRTEGERDDGKVRKDGTNLEISEADNAPEIFEDGNLRYRCRVETRDALSEYGSPVLIIIGSR